jgi:hypothetical protein
MDSARKTHNSKLCREIDCDHFVKCDLRGFEEDHVALSAVWNVSGGH